MKKYTELRSLLDDLKKEPNQDIFLRLMSEIYDKESYKISHSIKSNKDFMQLSTLQKSYILRIPYKLGNTAWGNGDVVSQSDLNSIPYYTFDNIEDTTKEDLPYLSKYMQAKVRKTFAKKRAPKAIATNLAMNEFSFIILKDSIKKPFNAVEANVLIQNVNKEFTESSKDTNSISLRNRYYKVILENTPVHTKTMLNNLYITPAAHIPTEDEAIALPSFGSIRDSVPYNTYVNLNEYSTDLTVATVCNIDLGEREVYRYKSGLSYLLYMHKTTGHDVYKTLATNMANNIKSLKSSNTTNLEILIEMNELLK